MNINKERIKIISAMGGMTNKNFKIVIDNKSYILRIPGSGTSEMINRKDEINNTIFANKIGIDSELVYFNLNTGIKISKFIENAETLNSNIARERNNMYSVCNLLKTLHNSEEKMKNNFEIYEKIELYENLLKHLNGVFFEDYYEVKSKIYSLKHIIRELDIVLKPCHNDTVAENFIKSKEGKIYLIDWEYAGMNDPIWDLSAYCLENNFTEDEEEVFLKIYFNNEVKEKYKKRFLINKIYQDFLWSIWTSIKEANGDNFGSYGINRYNRAKENLEKLLNGE